MSDIARTIGDLMRDQGRARAQAVREQAGIAAQSQRERGQIWGQTIQQLGQIAGNIPNQIIQAKDADLERQQRQTRIDIDKKTQARLDAAIKAQAEADKIVNSLPMDEDGTPNIEALTQRFAETNTPMDQRDRAIKSIAGVKDVYASFAKTKLEHGADVANAVLEMSPPGQPIPVNAVHLLLAGAASVGLATNADKKRYLDIIAAMPPDADMRPLLTAQRNAAPKYKDADKLIPVAAGTSLVNPSDPTKPVYTAPARPVAPPAETRATLAVKAANPDPAISEPAKAALKAMETGGTPIHVGSFEDYVARYAAAKNKTADSLTPADIEDARKRYQQADDRPRITVNTGADGALTPDAVEYTATAYRLLGTRAIPTRISASERVKILNEAAKQSKAVGQSPAAAVTKQLSTKADGAALQQVEKLAASADGFEQKAIAQADLIADLSAKVSRTKFPIINQAIQAGRERITGDEDATKLANAILTFTSEYSKIMAGATGSAAASSDSARHEAARLINTAMGKGTMAGVLDLMKWEMRQTIQGYDVARGHITERISGAPGTTPAPAAPRPPLYDPKSGTVQPRG